MSFNVIQCHLLSSLTVTILSSSQQLPLLDLSLSLSLSLPLPLDELVLIDAYLVTTFLGFALSQYGPFVFFL